MVDTLCLEFRSLNPAEMRKKQRSLTWKIINPRLGTVFNAIVNNDVLENNNSICIDEIILIRFEAYIVNNSLIFKKLDYVCFRNRKILH